MNDSKFTHYAISILKIYYNSFLTKNHCVIIALLQVSLYMSKNLIWSLDNKNLYWLLKYFMKNYIIKITFAVYFIFLLFADINIF